jgi:hypothetical protein
MVHNLVLLSVYFYSYFDAILWSFGLTTKMVVDYLLYEIIIVYKFC